MEDVIRPLRNLYKETVKRGSLSFLVPAPAFAVSAYALYVAAILYTLYTLTGNTLFIESIAAIGIW